jgi:hypothetical protein
MSQTATGDALATCSRIRDLILHHSGGWADSEALRQFRSLSQMASRAADDRHCSALMRTAEVYAADLFSHSSHLRWARGNTTGADVLRLCILEKLYAFRLRLLELQRANWPLEF